MINHTAAFIDTCEYILDRCAAAQTEAQRKAILSRQTVRGIGFAIDFCNSLDHEVMTERELSHAIRCTYYRGTERPVFIA